MSQASQVPDRSLTRAAVTVRARVADLDMVSPAEQHLLSEWLDRAIHDL